MTVSFRSLHGTRRRLLSGRRSPVVSHLSSHRVRLHRRCFPLRSSRHLEILVDTAKEEWGVDGYGSMNGLIRLRSPGHEAEVEEEDGGTSDSDVEVERRLDHDLSRFELIYPHGGDEHIHLLGSRFDDQHTRIIQLEEEDLTVKERLFLLGRELENLRRRVRYLEAGVNPEPVREINDDASEKGGQSCVLGKERS